MWMLEFLNRPVSQFTDFGTAVGVIGIVSLILLAWQMRALAVLIATLPRLSSFKQRSVLTENEAEFFGRLKRALPDFEISAQTAMSALIEPTVPRSHPKYWAYRQLFDRKVCDYLISRKGFPPGKGTVAVIELDDRTHDKRKDARRDAMLAEAGIPTLRYESRRKPSEAQIRRQVLAIA